MAILILEDDIVQAMTLRDMILEEVKAFTQLRVDCFVSENPLELLETANRHQGPHLYFIDTQIKQDQKAGLEIARTIRQTDKESLIVFVTTHSDLALLSYRYMVSAFNFIDKSGSVEDFVLGVQASLEEYFTHVAAPINCQEDQVVITFDSKSQLFQLPLDAIDYLTTGENHTVIIKGPNTHQEIYASLIELEDLHPDLIRIHRSYMVNINHVSRLDKSKRYLEIRELQTLPYSRKYYPKLLERLEG